MADLQFLIGRRNAKGGDGADSYPLLYKVSFRNFRLGVKKRLEVSSVGAFPCVWSSFFSLVLVSCRGVGLVHVCVVSL